MRGWVARGGGVVNEIEAATREAVYNVVLDGSRRDSLVKIKPWQFGNFENGRVENVWPFTAVHPFNFTLLPLRVLCRGLSIKLCDRIMAPCEVSCVYT